MKIVPLKTQQMSPTYLFITSTSPWKVRLVMHQVSMVIMNNTTNVFITWLDQAFLTVINMKINSALQQRNYQNYIYSNSTVHEKIPRLILHRMVKIAASMNSVPLDVIYNPSLHILKSILHNRITTINFLYKQNSCNEMVGPTHQ